MLRVLNKRTDEIPPGAAYVGRPGKWGNPMTIRELRRLFPEDTQEELNQRAVDWYKEYLKEYIKVHPEFLTEIIRELAGKDLVCWCTPLPCHADVLLELANKEKGDDHPTT